MGPKTFHPLVAFIMCAGYYTIEMETSFHDKSEKGELERQRVRGKLVRNVKCLVDANQYPRIYFRDLFNFYKLLQRYNTLDDVPFISKEDKEAIVNVVNISPMSVNPRLLEINRTSMEPLQYQSLGTKHPVIRRFEQGVASYINESLSAGIDIKEICHSFVNEDVSLVHNNFGMTLLFRTKYGDICIMVSDVCGVPNLGVDVTQFAAWTKRDTESKPKEIKGTVESTVSTKKRKQKPKRNKVKATKVEAVVDDTPADDLNYSLAAYLPDEIKEPSDGPVTTVDMVANILSASNIENRINAGENTAVVGISLALEKV